MLSESDTLSESESGSVNAPLGSTYFVRKSCSCGGRWVGTSGKMSHIT